MSKRVLVIVTGLALLAVLVTALGMPAVLGPVKDANQEKLLTHSSPSTKLTAIYQSSAFTFNPANFPKEISARMTLYIKRLYIADATKLVIHAEGKSHASFYLGETVFLGGEADNQSSVSKINLDITDGYLTYLKTESLSICGDIPLIVSLQTDSASPPKERVELSIKSALLFCERPK